MNDDINAFIDIIVLIMLLFVGFQFLVSSYNIINDKVSLDIRDDKTAIRNYSGKVLDSDPDVTYDYSSQDILLMSAIQDRYNPSNRIITVSTNKRSNFTGAGTATVPTVILDTNYSSLGIDWGSEDMTLSSYLNGDRKSFLQSIWKTGTPSDRLYWDVVQHSYDRILTADKLAVYNYGNILDLGGTSPPKWNLVLQQDKKIIHKHTRTGGGDYLWCWIRK